MNYSRDMPPYFNTINLMYSSQKSVHGFSVVYFSYAASLSKVWAVEQRKFKREEGLLNLKVTKLVILSSVIS